jgi:hypothetical protein
VKHTDSYDYGEQSLPVMNPREIAADIDRVIKRHVRRFRKTMPANFKARIGWALGLLKKQFVFSIHTKYRKLNPNQIRTAKVMLQASYDLSKCCGPVYRRTRKNQEKARKRHEHEQ